LRVFLTFLKKFLNMFSLAIHDIVKICKKATLVT